MELSIDVTEIAKQYGLDLSRGDKLTITCMDREMFNSVAWMKRKREAEEATGCYEADPW